MVKMSRLHNKKAVEQLGNGVPKTPKMAKSVPKGQLSKSKHTITSKRKTKQNQFGMPQDELVPKPVNKEDISSNWKSFLQVASRRSAEAAAATGPSRPAARRRGLARRGCSCPPPVWFDGVDPSLLREDRPECTFCQRQRLKESRREQEHSEEQQQLTKASRALPSRYIAMDCEMVGVGHSGQENMLARVSVVNSLCQPIYDKFVKPMERVTDYRTSVSGVRPQDLAHGESFEVVQKEVAALLKGRVLVGHAVHNDLKVLLLSHPKRHTRDTSSYKPFRRMFSGGIPSLKNLAHKILAVDIQRGEHDSVQDARATMQVYQTHRREWEAAVAERSRRRTGRPSA